jgi:signal transduction histidine kinase
VVLDWPARILPAARQAAATFALAGFLAFVALPTTSHPGHLLGIGIADLLIAAVAALLPWQRLRRGSTLVLAVPGFAVLAVSTWMFGGEATGTAPFFLLLYVWIGLHHPPTAAYVAAPFATAAYLLPLIATGQPASVQASAAVFIPVATAIAVTISSRVRDLNAARQRLLDTDRWRTALLDTLAHDVRAPLSAVHSTLRLLLEEPDLPPDRRTLFTERALRQTDRTLQLAGDLLDMGRVEHGELRLDRRNVSVRAAVAEAAGYVDTDIRIHIDHDLRVTADPQRLQQILVNLLGNATRHAAPPIVVTADNLDGWIRITVRDHGPGVPQDQRSKLFRRYSGDGAHSVGLGLWIARELAVAHGGEVTYRAADPGAAFIIILPGPAADEADSSSDSPPAPTVR